MATFTPQLWEDDPRYGAVLIEVHACSICEKRMVQGASRPPFPQFVALDIEKQLRAAGWVAQSKLLTGDGGPICVECAAAGRVTFVCALCHQERPSDQRQETFGDPEFGAEFLCTVCYETRSAKAWDEAADHLRDRHRYDCD